MNQFKNIMPESRCILPTGMDVRPFVSRAFYVMEIWKDIKGYEKLYQISNLGNVRSLTRNKPRSVEYTNVVYPSIRLCKNGKKKRFRIHKLMALAFIDSKYRTKGLVVNHKDGNKANNNLSNIEAVTYSENALHAYKIGLKKPASARGEAQGLSKLKEPDVLKIRLIGKSITQEKLGKMFGVSHRTIGAVLSRKTWKHI